MTKRMKPDTLLAVMKGKLDVTATAESTMTKLRKQKLRRQKTEARQNEGDAQPGSTAFSGEALGGVEVAGQKKQSIVFSDDVSSSLSKSGAAECTSDRVSRRNGTKASDHV